MRLLILIVCLLFASGSDAVATPATCQSVSAAYAAKNLDVLQVQYQASASHLTVCQARPGPTCCSRAMETALENRAKLDMYQTLYQQLVPRSTSLASLLSSFQALVRQMLNSSYDGLDKNLKSIYGYSYIENKQPFVAFYEGLRAYMSGGPDTVANLAKTLFDSISARLYVLVMTNYNIDEAYLTCVRSRLGELTPLGSMPERIGQEFVRAFVPARRFLAGLAALQDAVESAPAIRLSERCQRAELRSKYCAWCAGFADLQPCFELCSAALADCLAPLNALAEPFDQLLGELVQLSDKIRGPNNLYQVLNQLGLRISGGIMDMQERKDNIQAEVAKLCGPPKLKAGGSASVVQPLGRPLPGRRRRRRRSSDMFGWSYRSSDDPPVVSDAQERLGQLARSAKLSLTAIRGLFRPSSLALRACPANPAAPAGRCWNGTDSAAGYTAPSPPAASPAEPPSAAVSQRVANLRAAHRLVAELPRTENFAGFVEQRLDLGLSGLLNRRVSAASSRSGSSGASLAEALPIGGGGIGGGGIGGGGIGGGGIGGGSGSGAAPPPVAQPRPGAGGFPLRLSTLPPLTPRPPPPPSQTWRPLPPLIRPRPDTDGSGDSSIPPSGRPPPPMPDVWGRPAVTREPLRPPATRRPPFRPPLPPIVARTTAAPLPPQPPPVDIGGPGSGDEERPLSEISPPPVPGVNVPALPTTSSSVPGGATSGDNEPTGPPGGPPPRPVPSGWPRPPVIGGGEISGDGELPPPLPPQRPSPPTDSWWTPLPPPRPPQPPPQPPATRWPPVIPGPPPGSDLWLPKEPDDQGGAERGRGEGSIHGPMKMTGEKRACPPGSLACPACHPVAASTGALLLLTGLQRLLMLLR